MNLSYRQAEENDMSSIVNLLTKERGDQTNFDLHTFQVAVIDNKMAGCIRIKELKDCLELASLVVKSDYRNLGIGSTLVRQVLTNKKRRPIYLLCFKDKEHFYNTNGFYLISIESLPETLKNEYKRVKEKLAHTNLEIIAMRID
jgi:N-acetylglutamate synthase-like GNAT family acetyltransferase